MHLHLPLVKADDPVKPKEDNKSEHQIADPVKTH